MSKHSVASTRSQSASRLTIEDGMELWRAQAAYRAEGWWRTLCVVCFGLLLAFHLSRHHWVLAGEIGVLGWVAQWGVPHQLHLVVLGVRDGARGSGRARGGGGPPQRQNKQTTRAERARHKR